MSQELSFTMTNDSVVVFVEGRPTTVKRGAPNFNEIRKAILAEDWDGARRCLSLPGFLERWANGVFTLSGEQFYYQGQPVPTELNERIVALAAEGKSPEPVMNFFVRLQRNPSMRSVSQLWKFLGHLGIPLAPDGRFLAYKSVRGDWYDHHSGRHKNEIGTVLKMPRNQISDDPSQGCHQGFHVGALEYARSFGGANSRILICAVDPEHVVCVPYDSQYQKMRVCEYEVMGQYNGGHMDSVIEDDEPLLLDDDDVAVEPSADDLPGFDDDYDCESWTDGTEKPSPEHTDEFHHVHSADGFDDLMSFPMDVLRRYASKHLKIVGAYKIPGGKIALIEAIQKAR